MTPLYKLRTALLCILTVIVCTPFLVPGSCCGPLHLTGPPQLVASQSPALSGILRPPLKPHLSGPREIAACNASRTALSARRKPPQLEFGGDRLAAVPVSTTVLFWSKHLETPRVPNE